MANDAMKKAKMAALMKLMHPGNVGMPGMAAPHAPKPPMSSSRAQMLAATMQPQVPPASDSGAAPMPPAPQGFAMGGMFPKLSPSIDPSMPKPPTADAVTPIGGLASLKDRAMSAIHAAPLSTAKGLKESMTKKTKPKM